MRRFKFAAFTSAIALINISPSNADTAYFLNSARVGYSSPTYEIFEASRSGSSINMNKLTTFTRSNNEVLDDSQSWYSQSDNKLYFLDTENYKFHTYDLKNDSWENNIGFSSETNDNDVWYMRIPNSNSIIRQDSQGVISVGENSLKLQETSTQQKMWGTNASGESVPINITNGSKLLINGRDVEQAIDNVGALSAALTGLPTVPEDSPLSCGLGVGAHSGSNAFSGGCASKVNERLTLNYAASIIPAKQDYQGTDNSWSGRAGFVFKLGKINKPTLISMKEKKEMQTKISDLSTSNSKMQAQNKELLAKVDSFELEKAALVARLEKIEQIALANQKNEKTAFSFLNASNLFSSVRSFLISSN